MSKLKIMLLILSILSHIRPALSQSNQKPWFWIALKGPYQHQYYTNFDVENYLIDSQFSDEDHINLFIKSNKDYDAYEKNWRTIVAPYFNSALKQLAYTIIVQMEASRPTRPAQWSAFNTTSGFYERYVNDKEKQLLKPFLDKGLSIKKARIEQGKKLITINYPHRSSDSVQDVYKSWYQRLRSRILIDVRLKEVRKFERIKVLGPSNGKLPIQLSAPNDAIKAALNFLESKVIGKKLSKKQLEKTLEQMPEASLLLSKVDLIDASSTPVSDLKGRAPQVFTELKNEVQKLKENLFKKNLKEKLKYYFTLPKKLLEKHNTNKNLMEKREEANQEFILKGNYQQLVMGKLYELTALLPQGNDSTQEINNIVNRSIEKADQVLNTLFDNPSSISMSIEEYFERSFDKDLESLKDRPFLYKVQSFIVFTMKFHIKKMTTQISNQTEISLYKKDNKTLYKQMKQFVETKAFGERLSVKRKEWLKKYASLFTIVPDGVNKIIDSEALNFIQSEMK